MESCYKPTPRHVPVVARKSIWSSTFSGVFMTDTSIEVSTTTTTSTTSTITTTTTDDIDASSTRTDGTSNAITAIEQDRNPTGKY